MNFIVSATTDIGLTKSTNQDSYNVRVFNTKIGKVVLAVLCDGMGGLSKGEVASASLVNAFCKWADNKLPFLCENGINDSDISSDWVGIATEYNEKFKSYADIHNGRTFTFKNFAEEKAIDDIYTLTATLTDKAGNTTTQTVTFSVNRFGSTYALSDAAEQLNGTYVKEAVDVVLTETNADELSNIKITLFKDGEATVLKEGTDYKIEVTGGNGQWFHYIYIRFLPRILRLTACIV